MNKSILLLTFLVAFHSYAQKAPIKFGKVTEEELLLEKCDFYPEASSMILGSFGEVNFIYNSNKGWQYSLKVLVRKKIFKNTDKDAGSISIRLYNPVKGTNKEELGTVRAFTYNFDGKDIQKTKLANSEKFETRINDYWVKASFAMPDVREGSVVEYEYNVISDYISNLTTWYFQEELPVASSEFRFTIPEFFNYQRNMVGYYHPVSIEEKNVDETFTYQYTSAPQSGGRIERGTGSLPSKSTITIMRAANIPPLEDEPYMNNKSTIPTRLEFQLMSIQYPYRPMEYIAGSYEKFTEELVKREDFGKAMDRGGFAKDFISGLSGKSDLDKALGIYSWIRSSVSWNEVYTFIGDKVGRSLLTEGKGSVADINTTLIAAFREAGFSADPVILSTRGHGIVHPVYPSYSDFNYMIAMVVVNNKTYLVDASSGLAFGKLPIRCLNGNGWVVKQPKGAWVNLKEGAEHVSVYSSTIKFTEGKMLSTYTVQKDGYSAIQSFGQFKKDGDEAYASQLSESFPDWTFNNFSFSEESSPENVKLSFEISQDFHEEDIVYISPILHGGITENPFKRETRFSPIDLEYGITNKVLVNIEIPDGYTAELPKPSIVKLPEGGGTFIYSTSMLGNTITVVSNLLLKQKDFSAKEYSFLKEFFQLMTDKNNETIVLKKI